MVYRYKYSYRYRPRISMPRINMPKIKIPKRAFQYLGLKTSCSIQDAKQAFRIKVKKVHPDYGGNEADFIKLSENYKKVITYLKERR